jgi:N-hydroxyarylamine O-acetyltransferase
MTQADFLDAYFERIQWRHGVTGPTYETLAALLDAHMASIPFENLDVLLGHPVRLDLDSLQDKLVRRRRGGYCFEHATLFAAVLEQLGFAPVRHSARVTLFAPRTASPRTHMFLTVALGPGVFVVDPGFGGLAPRFPVPLAPEPAAGSASTHRMVRDGAYWVLRVRTGEKTVDAWVSSMEEDHPIDFEMANHYTSTHPASGFVNRLMMRAFSGDRRVTVMNRDVTVWRGEESATTQIADRAALRALVSESFGFDLPEIERLRVPAIPEWTP